MDEWVFVLVQLAMIGLLVWSVRGLHGSEAVARRAARRSGFFVQHSPHGGYCPACDRFGRIVNVPDLGTFADMRASCPVCGLDEAGHVWEVER